MQTQSSEYKKGLFYGLICYFTWGLFPLYWKMLEHVSSIEILCHRMLWSCVFMIIVFLGIKKIKLQKYIHSQKQLWMLLFTGCLMTCNWGLYIWAINHHYIVQSSLGYYINPLLNVLLGYIFLKERLNKSQIIALVFAAIGVLYFTIDYGRFPIISIILASSFAIYGLLKKKMGIEASAALSMETIWMAPFALFYISKLWITKSSALNTFDWSTTILLIGAGIITALPLLWFGKSAEHIPLSTLGFIQYISPTLQLIIGITLYHEDFTLSHVICFLCIWVGLLIYSTDIIMTLHRNRKLQHSTIKIENKHM